ncbi:MAG: leucine--tRNA ligase, partial [Candidatus Woesearchaeota archaeon]
VVDAQGKKIDEIETFTTRPDTIFGITYLVLAVEHPKCVAWTKGTSHEKAVTDFIREVGKKSLIERTAEGKEKNGVFLGKYIINPVNGKKCPIWTADYALMDYGTGAVMAVPTHDQRDFEFAKKYDLPLQVVINPLDGWELDASKMNRAYVNEGKLVNSGEFDGLLNRDAIVKISEWLETKGWGKRTVTYKLRDWLISRQRYWGTPIPVYYDDEGNPHPIPENELPVILPDDVDFTKGGNPLTTSDSFKYYIDSQTGKKYRRETDTMDTFIDSSWYFLRYTDTTRNSMINVEDAKYWMPVDQYIGGIEHACMHLIYARFFTKVLRDMGLVSCDEPFKRLLTQGMVIKDGAKMSKSIGNVVDPGEIIDKFGPDTARMFILFTALPEKELDWNDKGVEGCYRFLRRVYTLLDYKVSFDDISSMDSSEWSEYDAYVVSLLHRTIGSVSQDMDLFRVSIAIGSLMNFVTKVHEYARNNPNPQILGACIKNIILMLSPVAPHLSEEMWEQCGFKEFCSVASWPEASEKYINGHVESAYEMVERTISDIHSVVKLARVKSVSKLTLFVSPEWKYDFMKIFKESLNETRNVGEIIKRVLPTAPDAHKKDISGLVPRLLKNQSLVPYVVLSAEEEYKALKTYTGLLEKTFNCSISIEYAQGASHAKALSALPGKPSILVE